MFSSMRKYIEQADYKNLLRMRFNLYQENQEKFKSLSKQMEEASEN